MGVCFLNKLQRSSNNSVFSGVCGGIGEFFTIDPTIVRIIWIIVALSSFGTAFLAYLACSLIIPVDDGVIYQDGDNPKVRHNTPLLIGGGLVIWGGYLLAKIFFPWFSFRFWNLWRYWPVLLIILGIYILINQKDK